MAETATCTCGGTSSVLESRPGADGTVRRRRRCDRCRFTWATREVRVAMYTHDPITIVLPPDVTAVEALRVIADAIRRRPTRTAPAGMATPAPEAAP